MFGVFENIRYLCSLNTVNYVCKVYQARGSRFERNRQDTGLLQNGAEAHDVSQFLSLCHREGRMDESQILSAMSLVSEKLALCMAEGFSVKLDGIGTFNAKLGVRDDKLPDAFEEGETSRNAKSIMVNGVSYRADKKLIRNTDRKCMLVRGGESRLKKSPFTQEERIQKARDFLNAHHFMKVPDYVRLTGLSRTTAAEELRKLARDPSTGITSQGNRSQKVYILRQ